MEWFAVRCVIEHLDLAVFEERVTLWNASSFAEAIEFAEREVGSYVEGLDAEYVGLVQACGPLDDEPAHGAEVFSLMRWSDLAADEYVTRFFDTGDEREQT